jgi:putative transposase
MPNKRPKPEEIVVKLRQVDVLVGQGMTRIDAIREIGVIEQTYYRWRKQYGGMGTDQVKELKRLQKESDHLRRAVYGMGAAGLAATVWNSYRIEMTRSDAAQALSSFFRKFHRLGEWMRSQFDLCTQRHRIEIGAGRVFENARGGGVAWRYSVYAML